MLEDVDTYVYSNRPSIWGSDFKERFRKPKIFFIQNKSNSTHTMRIFFDRKNFFTKYWCKNNAEKIDCILYSQTFNFILKQCSHNGLSEQRCKDSL